MKRRAPSFLVALSIVAILSAACDSGAPATQTAPPAATAAPTAAPTQAFQLQGPIKIGSLVILSGPIAAVGEDIVKAARFALDEVNASGGIHGAKVEIVFADDKADPAEAVRQATRLIQEDKVSAVLGPVSSGPAVATVAVTKRFEVPQVAYNAGSLPLTKQGSQYIFRTYPVLENSFATLVQYGNRKLGYKKFAFLGWSELAGTSALEGMKMGLPQAAGASIVEQQQVPITAQDLSGPISKLRAANPDVVAIAAPMPLGGLMVKQIRDSGWNVPLMGWLGFYTDDFFKFTGKASDGMTFMAAYHVDAVETAFGKKFVDKWTKQFGSPPNDFNTLSYEVAWIAFKGIEQARSPDPKKIAEALHGLTFEGVRTTFKWDAAGDFVAPIVALKWENGKQVLLDKKP